jgi:sortase A
MNEKYKHQKTGYSSYDRGPERKVPLRAILSLGCLVLGIVFAGWALLQIAGTSVNLAEVFNRFTSDPSSYTLKQSISVEDDSSISEAASNIKNTDGASFLSNPVEGDRIGSLTIPVLDRVLPIFQGTDTETLDNGVGHFAQSVMPGEEDNSVLSGHRDTVFTKLGELKIGDQLIVETAAGIFTYEVKGTRIVDKEDKTVIVPTDHAVLTLTTCYPFHFVGNAPDRYIVIADLVSRE